VHDVPECTEVVVAIVSVILDGLRTNTRQPKGHAHGPGEGSVINYDLAI